MVSTRPLRIGQLVERTGVSKDKIERCIEAGLISFDRLPNGYRMFGSDATRLLQVYRALEELPFNLNHPERRDIINTFSLETLEGLENQGGDVLRQWVAEHLVQIRKPPSVEH